MAVQFGSYVGQDDDLRRETTEILVAALGEPRLRDLRAQGESMNDDETVAYALDTIGKAQIATSAR